METELKEKIRNLKYDEKIEFDYKNIKVTVQNFKYDVKVSTKPNLIFKAIALLILMFVFALIGVLLYGAGVKAGGLTMILILFLYKPLATEVSKIFYYNKLKELKQELSDVKFGEVETNLNYSKKEDTNRNKAIDFSDIEKENIATKQVRNYNSKVDLKIVDYSEKVIESNFNNKFEIITARIGMIIIIVLLVVVIFAISYDFIDAKFDNEKVVGAKEYFQMLLLMLGVLFTIFIITVLLQFSKSFLFKDIRLVNKKLKNQIKQTQQELNTLS